MIPLVVATRNFHKVEEIRAILGEGYRYITMDELPGAPMVVEDANTFDGNARKKANELAGWIANNPELIRKNGANEPRYLVLADDSGLEVDALEGAPGVHSARFAAKESKRAGNSPDAENCALLLQRLNQVPIQRRTARFKCVIALVTVTLPAPGTATDKPLENEIIVADGTCDGLIARQAEGEGGFGYDPLFIPDGHTNSFGTLPPEVKNRLSHRAQALGKLKSTLADRTETSP